VPTPSRGNYPESPLLKHANVKSLTTFENARSWKLSKREAIPAEDSLEAAVHRLVERAFVSGEKVAKR
jgi:hypothetical protein